MTKDSLSISVVIVTLDRAESVRDVLDCLVRQTRQPDEVIVVDNGSKDNTKEVVSSFDGRLNIKYVYEEARGIPFARNAGVRNATGDIIAFIDDDCIADENWLKYIEIPFIRDPNVGVVGGDLSYLEKGESILEKFHKRYMR
ncbi:MAG TPA: glycosyltransferase family 2 protein [Dehalococcoidia bacterium]|nr:glycosyltransferase family 2 protein [Dehalococcoidia bacterium]